MNRRCEISSTTHRQGATLIEVLAGLVILGTLLVSIAAARGRFARQWVEADGKLSAVRAADKMLADWMAGAEQNIPVQAQGDLAGVPKCLWRTREVRSQGAEDLRARVIRLEIFDRTSRSREPLFYVEFLVHDYRQRVEGGAMRRGGFTLIELMLASTLSVLLIGGVLFALAALSRDTRGVVAKDPSADLKGTLELLQWDLSNARSVSQSADHRTIVLEGHGAIAPDTLRPNGRLARVVYLCQLRGGVWRLTRGQQYLDDPARPQNWTDLVGTGMSSVEVLAVGGQEDESKKMPQWVRVRVYGPGGAVEKQVCIR